MLCELGVAKLWISIGQGDNHSWIPVHDVCPEIGPKAFPSTLSQTVVSHQLFVERRSATWQNGMLIQ